MESEANIVPTLLEKGITLCFCLFHVYFRARMSFTNKDYYYYLNVLFHPNSSRYRLIFIRI